MQTFIMLTIPTDIQQQLRTVLLNCEPFDSQTQLKAIFVDDLLTQWRDHLPEANNSASRVEMLVDFLSRQSSDHGNGLLLFLQILARYYDPFDERHQQLQELTTSLQALISPATDDDLPTEPSKEALVRSLETVDYVILVVDDDVDWQERLKRFLQKKQNKYNYGVLTAGSYEAAQNLLKTIFLEQNTPLHLVTMDLTLDEAAPYPEGLDLLDYIRDEFGPELPLIVVTGTGDMDKQRQAFKDYNTFDFIQKAEITSREFCATVQEAIEQRFQADDQSEEASDDPSSGC